MLKKRKTKVVKAGNLKIGGNNPIVIQSMTITDTRDVKKTVAQIKKMEEAGCEAVRIAVPDDEAASKISKIKSQINIPLIADIHFSANLALKSIEQGIDKLRINPGNVQPMSKMDEIAAACKRKKIPIRIGINGGSLEKDILKKYKNKATSEGMVDSAMKHIRILEKLNFKDIMVSLKSSDIGRTVEAYRKLAKKVSYPLHVGITEAGTRLRGTITSSIGIGILLYEGIGDTIRVSLTGDPIEELRVAREILSSLGLRKFGPVVISCPTCGRTQINLFKLVKEVEKAVVDFPKYLKIAVMGCVVNGPGEAREADLAVVGGKNKCYLCRKGKIIKEMDERLVIDEFKKELDKHL